MTNEEMLKNVAGELARVHGVLFDLLVRLYKTQLSPTQKALLQAADADLSASQRFLATYAEKN